MGQGFRVYGLGQGFKIQTRGLALGLKVCISYPVHGDSFSEDPRGSMTYS